MGEDRGTVIPAKKSRLSGFSRRKFIAASGLGAAGILSAFYFGSITPSETSRSQSPAFEEVILNKFAKSIQVGGPGKDGIPPIDNPKYLAVGEANKILTDEDVVFGLEHGGVVRAYPQIVMVWHEIVNENINGERISITYCPLTGSAVGFKGLSKVNGEPLTFGTSGNLVNSNLLMYDRQSDSNWPQILGTAINGLNKGITLNHLPVVWTTWGLWKEVHPDTQVLSTDTGFVKIYGYDPYGSYTQDPANNYYYRNPAIYFPVLYSNDRFHRKKVVTGVMHKGSYLAIPKGEFSSIQVANATLGGDPIVAIYDGGLDTTRVFLRRAAGRELNFQISGTKVTDIETGSDWSLKGEALSGRLSGTKLTAVKSFDVMWFAWFAFFPSTLVYG